MKIDWTQLEIAFQNRDESFGDQSIGYLDRTSGQVVWVGGEFGIDKEEAFAENPERLIEIPTVDTPDEVDWMRQFHRTLRNRNLIRDLDAALSGGRGIFRRFREALGRHPALDAWHKFHNRRFALFMVGWLRDEKIEFEGLPRELTPADLALLEDGEEQAEWPVRATMELALDGYGMVRFADAIESLEARLRDCDFEYDVTVRIRSDRPLSQKARAALEKQAIHELGTRPTFVEDAKPK